MNRENAVDSLDWSSVLGSFHVLPAPELLKLERMERLQDLDAGVWWHDETPPLAFLFISHRWETLAHPDPDRRQLRAIQELVRLVSRSVEALFLPRAERTSLIPSLDREGIVQSVEIARRALGFGPFGDATAALGGRGARQAVRDQWEHSGGGTPFRGWVASRIAVWLDYCCMPQQPLTQDEEAEFRSSLATLGALVRSASVVALRCRDDDYPRRAWCASEFFLGSRRSFANGLYVDLDRLTRADEVATIDAPVARFPEDDPLVGGYEQDRGDFERTCRDWVTVDAPLVDVTPPAAWAPYRWMAGDGTFSPGEDPNPFRLLLNALMEFETDLIRRWFLSDTPLTIDLASEAEQCLARHDLHCADPRDLSYLGVLTGANGWVEELRPLFRAALGRFSQMRGPGRWRCVVELDPPTAEIHELFGRFKPSSPDVWHSRLATGPVAGEKETLEALQEKLRRRPPEFRLVESPDLASSIDSLR
jgi:hypothetical protein